MTNSEMPQQDKKLTTKSDAGVKRDRAIDASDAGLDKVLWVTSNFQKISSPIVCTLLVTALLILAVGVVYYAPNLALFGFMALMAYAGALSAISRLRGARLLSRWNVMRFA